VIDIGIFQSQAIEIRKRVSKTQQDLLAKVETIQNHCQIIDQVLEDISLRERSWGSSGRFPRGCHSHNEKGNGQ
jgi:hypothetical protein